MGKKDTKKALEVTGKKRSRGDRKKDTNKI